MILVIGATGNIGSEVVRLLVERQIPVRALVRNPKRAGALEVAGVQLVQGDLDRPETLEAAFEGVERVFLVSAASQTQVAQQSNAVQAAKRAGVKQIVKVSALGTDLSSPVALGRWHATTEDEIRRSGIAYTFLHPTMFMQNFLMSAETIQGQGAIYAPMKDGRIPFVDARDIAAVGVAALTTAGHEGKTYAITGAESLGYAEAAGIIGSAIGSAVNYVDVPPEAAAEAMRGAGMPEWFIEDMLKLFAFFSSGAGAEAYPTVQQVTGRAPRTLEAFARDHAAAFRGVPAQV